jgi:hypothetical protein
MRPLLVDMTQPIGAIGNGLRFASRVEGFDAHKAPGANEADHEALSRAHHALASGGPCAATQEAGFDPSPIRYMLEGRQEAQVEERHGQLHRHGPVRLPKRTGEQAVKGAISTAHIYRGLVANGPIRKNYLHGDAGTGRTEPFQGAEK